MNLTTSERNLRSRGLEEPHTCLSRVARTMGCRFARSCGTPVGVALVNRIPGQDAATARYFPKAKHCSWSMNQSDGCCLSLGVGLTPAL
jgi:hypothetical protein